MRYPALAALLMVLPAPVLAQGSVASDLWRVAAGTETVPLALADGGTAGLWTPAVALASGERLAIGVEAVNSPAEIGASGALVGALVRLGSIGTASIGWGRLTVADVELTETSPEAIGSVPIANQTLSLGLARPLLPGLTVGLAVRYLSGVLGTLTRDQVGIDGGLRVQGEHYSLGAATRFFDPTLRAALAAASYEAGAEARSAPLDAWGVPAVLHASYGITAYRGESAQHLFMAGVALGTSLAVDGGASAEQVGGNAVLRSRFGLTIGAGRFRVQIGRDGGINGFGAAYRFALSGTWR